MKLVIEVTNCSDCPLRKSEREQGATFTYCDHPNRPLERRGYERMLDPRTLDVVPDWCPIRKK